MENYLQNLKLAFNKIRNSKNVLLIGHLSPDADALSSVSIFIDVLSSLNIQYYAFTLLKKDNEYKFIPNSEKINSTPPPSLEIFDTIVIFDCGSIKRTGIEKEILNTKLNNKSYIIDIDHHENDDNYADIEIRRPDKASTTMIIYDLLKTNNWPINKNISSCVFSGIVGDTGCFLHSNSSAEAIKMASETLSYGASFHTIIKESTKTSNILSLKIWGKVIDNIYFNKTSGLISSGLRESDMEEIKNHFASEETSIANLYSVIVSFLCSVSGVSVALLLREEHGMIKGSLRTNKNDVDVSKIAGMFGGGGHKKASGFCRKGKLIKTDNGWKILKNIQ